MYKCVCVCVLSHVQLFATPWTVTLQAPLSMEYFRHLYWSRLPFPFSGGPPNPGIEPESCASPALAGRFLTSWAKCITIHMFLKTCVARTTTKKHTHKKRLRQDVICLQSDSWQHCLNNPWVHEFVLWPRDRKEGNEEEEEVTGSLLSKSLQYRLNHVNGTCGKYPRIKTK